MLNTIPKSLMNFTNLRDLHISFDDVNLRGQQKAIQTLITRFSVSSLTLNPERSLKTLILTFLPRIDVPLLRSIASTFPLLVNLALSCTERLYGWRLEENWSCTNHSPIPDMFNDAPSLAVRLRILYPKLRLIPYQGCVLRSTSTTRSFDPSASWGLPLS